MIDLKTFTLLLYLMGISSLAAAQKSIDEDSLKLATEVHFHAKMLYEMGNECQSLKKDVDWLPPYNKFLAELREALEPQTRANTLNATILKTVFAESALRAKNLVEEGRSVNGCGTSRFQGAYSEAEKSFSKSLLRWAQR